MDSIPWKKKGSVEKDISAFLSYQSAAGSDKLSCQLYITLTSWLYDLQRQKLKLVFDHVTSMCRTFDILFHCKHERTKNKLLILWPADANVSAVKLCN